ncbi:MAG: hypothetical protein WAX77_06220 [Methylococcaceae bacterium]
MKKNIYVGCGVVNFSDYFYCSYHVLINQKYSYLVTQVTQML